ncbi:MAG: response regulator [Rhizobiaceae bacterium]
MAWDPSSKSAGATAAPAEIAPENGTAQRRIIDAPALAPSLLSAAPGRGLLAIAAAAVVLAILIWLSASPLYLSAATLFVGFASVWLYRRMLRDRERLARLEEENSASRVEFETLADRMWELQESEERFRGLIDALGDIVVHRDREGRIVYANRVLADLVGWEQRALSGRKLSDFGIDVGIMPDAALSDGECLSSTDVAIQTGGETRWYSWIELSVRDKAGDAVSHRAIARDITGRKQAEEASIAARERAEFANKAKSRFLATVSHEIRTPMNGIMGMAKLLTDTRLSPEQKTYVGAISTSANALLALIEDLLDFSKIEAGRFDMEFQPVSPRELVENVAELLAARAYAQGIGLGCYCAPDAPQRITADPDRLRQVLLNLIGNAIKFTETGGVLVSVTRSPDTEAAIRFSVTDTGAGLTQADFQRVFQEFEQADSTSTRRHGGAGLGLAISKRIVEAMNGTIAVESELGEGACFFFDIPVGQDGLQGIDPAPLLAGSLAVILSENEPEAAAMALTLEAYGCGVEKVRSLDAAAERIAAAPADFSVAVLIDARLDDRNGKLLGRLRQRVETTFEAITLIAPTDRDGLDQYRSNGYSTFLARPVRGETLLRVLTARQASPLAPAGPQSVPTPREEPAALPRAGLSILLAEDNEINALLARSVLTKAGHEVHVVANGRQAVEALIHPVEKSFDLVLMDLHMPVMDGLDAIALIRQEEEEKGLPPIPIMVLSADGQEGTRHAVLAHGATGFVTKPLDPKALIEAVAEQAVA